MTETEGPGAWGVIVRRYGMILDRRTLGEGEITIGRDVGCDLVLDDPGVSRRAARLDVEDGDLVVRDLGSLAGIKIGGEPVSERRVQPGDVIEVGPFEIEISGDAKVASAAATTMKVDAADVTGLSRHSASSTPVKLLLPDGSSRGLDVGTHVLGRGADCDVRVVGETVSKRHAELRVAYGSLRIVDLDSTNGTSWDDQAIGDKVIDQSGRLHLGDELVEVKVSRTAAPAKRPSAASSPPESEETIRVRRSDLRRPPPGPDVGAPPPTSDTAGSAAGDASGDPAAHESPADDDDDRGPSGAPEPGAVPSETDGPQATPPGPAQGRGRSRRLLLLVLLVVAVIVVLLVIVSESRGDSPVADSAAGTAAVETRAEPVRSPR